MSEKRGKRPDPVPHGGGFGGGPADRFRPLEKAKDSRKTLSRLMRFYLKEGKSLFVVAGLLIVQTGVGVAIPLIIGRAVDAMTSGTTAATASAATATAAATTATAAAVTATAASAVDFTAVGIFVAILVLAYIASTLIDISQGVMMNKATQSIVRALRKSLFAKLQTLPLIYHDSKTHGELMSRMTNDVDNISMTIAQSTTQLVSVTITLIGSLTIMLLLNVWMTLAALVTVPLVFLTTKYIAKRSKKMFVEQQTELGELNGLIEETIAGQRIVKAFNMEKTVIERFARVNEQLRNASTSANLYSGMLMPAMHVIVNLGYLSVAVTGGALAAGGFISVGVIATFIIYQRQFTYPLNNLAGTFTMLQSALAGAERVFELMDEADEPDDIEGAVEMINPKGDVTFENVTFAYTTGADVLHNVSFDVKAGSKIALVGETGAGKTTVVNLLSRFYDVNSGAVYIDGVDIRKYKRDSLRRAFSVVLQDTCLFTGTIADNIRYSRADASFDEVVEAAKTGGAHEFIIRLRDGYDTMVSSGSESLSQGQRQLLAISRAVLSRSPILILDEATSSVDTRTELRIQAAMTALAKGSTSFVIAHRLSTIRDADLILVMADGEIIERGNHNELIALNGTYAKMHTTGG